MNVYVRELARSWAGSASRWTSSPGARTLRSRRSALLGWGLASSTSRRARPLPRPALAEQSDARSSRGGALPPARRATTSCSTATTGSRASRQQLAAAAGAGPSSRCSTPSARSRTRWPGARREPDRAWSPSGGSWRRWIASSRPTPWSAPTWPGTTGRVRVIPCGVDLDLFQPADPRPPGRASASRRSTSCSSWAGWPRSRGWRRSSARAAAKANGLGGPTSGWSWSRRQGRALGRRASGAARAGGHPGVARWVDFRGPQPQAALPDYYAAADLCVMPSLYESFGMVALEAMACKVPSSARG